MSLTDVARVHYFTRQFLRTDDFTDEQNYHIAMRRRHLIAHHSWGIVRGLEITVEEGNLFVQPGLAVDGYGRELILADKRPLSTSVFMDKQSNALDVWLVYDRVGIDQAPPGYADCGEGDGSNFYRWQEIPQIWLEAPEPGSSDRRSPKEAPQGDLGFNPARTPPDDPQHAWPVFLGQIIRDPAKADSPYSVDPSDRPYAGLTGRTIAAPSGRALVRLAQDKDPPGFAVFIPDQDTDPRLEIDSEKTTIRGETSIHGNLTMAGGAVEFKVSDSKPLPWRIYHYQGQDPEGASIKDELRLVIDRDSQGNNQAVIGHWDDDVKKFVPCLTVDAKCNVTIHGNLEVEGSITKGGMVSPVLSPEAAKFTVSTLMSGISGANVLLNRFFESSAGPQAPQGLQVEMMAEYITNLSSVGLEKLVDLIGKKAPKKLKNLHDSAGKKIRK